MYRPRPAVMDYVKSVGFAAFSDLDQVIAIAGLILETSGPIGSGPAHDPGGR
jgi:hypothetical protein